VSGEDGVGWGECGMRRWCGGGGEYESILQNSNFRHPNPKINRGCGWGCGGGVAGDGWGMGGGLSGVIGSLWESV